MSFFDNLKNLGRAAGLPWMPPQELKRPLDAVVLPEDERSHDRLIEWWHFVGTFKVVDKATSGHPTDPTASSGAGKSPPCVEQGEVVTSSPNPAVQGPVAPKAQRMQSLAPASDDPVRTQHSPSPDDPEPPDDLAGRRFSFIASVLKGRVMGLDQIGSMVVLIDEAAQTRHATAKSGAAATSSFDAHDGQTFFFQFGAGPSRPGPPTGWKIVGGMGAYRLDIDTQEQISMRLAQPGPAVLLGEEKAKDKDATLGVPLDGIERYESGEELAYVVWPFLQLNGTMNVGLEQHDIRGQAWMEHQWGDVRVGAYRWKFIALMDDPIEPSANTDIGQAAPAPGRASERFSFFVCEPVATQGPVSPLATALRDGKGYRLQPNGNVNVLHHVEFTHTLVYRGYPLETRVEFDDPDDETKRRSYLVTPKFSDQFIDGAISPAYFPEFWEGVCEVTDPAEKEPSKTRRRWAMTELVGYRRSTR